MCAHYNDKRLIEGLDWKRWVTRCLGRAANCALELGCGSGRELFTLWRSGCAIRVEGIDLDEARFSEVQALQAREPGFQPRLIVGDANEVRLEENRYDLIYAVHSFHHFMALERIMAEVRRALTADGLFVLEEYVGPAKFQWTDLQLELTERLLALIPRHLRMYTNGIEKRRQERDPPERVLEVCPSEALRSDEIVPLFYENFRVLAHRPLGGTIQHILYAGIIHNFPDDDPDTNRMIDSIDAIESLLISARVIGSDFALLVGAA